MQRFVRRLGRQRKRLAHVLPVGKAPRATLFSPAPAAEPVREAREASRKALSSLGGNQERGDRGVFFANLGAASGARVAIQAA
ncbi:MAG TPA: hypothetical protein VGD42_19650 [Lysobacter sp.]